MQASEEERASRILREELAQLGWTRKDLKAARKADRRKLKIARRLRDETTMSWEWISTRLETGVWRYLANAVRQSRTPPRGK